MMPPPPILCHAAALRATPLCLRCVYEGQARYDALSALRAYAFDAASIARLATLHAMATRQRR